MAAISEACGQQAQPDFGDALAQPLRDLSILRPETPEVLQRATIAPYADPPTLPSGALDCPTVATEIETLDAALGDDVDVAIPQTSLMAEAGMGTSNAIVDAVGDLVELPYRSVIRHLTGAERRDREMRSAVQAGMVRRAFLKGLSARECSAPQLIVAFDVKPHVSPSDLELAWTQLAAANAAAATAARVQPSERTPNGALVLAAGLSELELARMQLAAANAAAAAAAAQWSPPYETDSSTSLSDLELARAQLAAANAAAADAASAAWTPRPAEPVQPEPPAHISDLELARTQLAAWDGQW